MPAVFRTLTFFCLLAFAGPAVAAPENPPGNSGGQIEAELDGKQVYFPLLKTDIHAVVKGDLATVTLEQVYTNPTAHPLHARYLFPLSHEAAVNKMVMEVGDERIEAKIQKAEEAKKTFEKAKSEGKAASLLTEHRPNMFTQDIANLMPNLPVKVTLTYVQTLPKLDGQYEMALPLVVGPRYQPAGAGVPLTPVAQVDSTEKFGKWEIEQLTAYPPVMGLNIPGTVDKDRVAVEIDLDGGMPLNTVSSPTHEIREEKISEQHRIIHLAETRTVDNKDFVLRYGISGKTTQAGLLAHKDERGGFFSLQLEPPAIPVADDIAAREIVFVLDTSGSMDGEPIAASKLFMKHALNGLRAQDYFRIIRFSNNASEFTTGPVPASQDNIAKGQAYVESLTADGGTEAQTGIEQAFGVEQQPDTLRLVVLLTDGYIGDEATLLQMEAEKIGDARLYAFGVGNSVNRYLLDEMGRMGRGFARIVDPSEKSEDAAMQLAAKLETPVLTDISVDWGDLKPDGVVPEKIPDLFAGSAIRLQGKYASSGTHEITVHGRVNGRKAALPVTIDLPEASENDSANPIPVIWARTQIAEAMRLINTPSNLRNAKDGSDDVLKQKVVKLGLDFSLMTKWTSFVAVSKRIVNTHSELAQQRDVPLRMVKGITHKAYPGIIQTAANEVFSGGSAPEPPETAGMIVIATLALFAALRRHRESVALRLSIYALRLYIFFVRNRAVLQRQFYAGK